MTNREKRSILKRVLDGAWCAIADVQYRSDGFATTHMCKFLEEDKFRNAYIAGANTNHLFGKNLHIEWRSYICCMAALQSVKMGGLLIECGVNTGINALTIAKFLQFDIVEAPLYFLMDTFDGVPSELIGSKEVQTATRLNRQYRECYSEVAETFARFPNVRLIRGILPGTLAELPPDPIGYISLDLNIAAPERDVLEELWDRLLPGGIIVLDDYLWSGHEEQKKQHDAFATSRGIGVLPLPTGQGLLIKA